jgi:hypothetical protein
LDELSSAQGVLRVNSILSSLSYVEVIGCLAALLAITVKKQWTDYWSLGAFLAARLLADSILVPLFPLTRHSHGAYVAYFYVYWSSFAVESILALIVVYGIFRLAMAPLKGLQSLGMLVFRWAAAISVAVSLGSAFTPGQGSTRFLIHAISELQRTQSILTLCLLVFVCFAVRPMGLSFSSRIFGVSLGLGIMATNDLVQAAWFSGKSHINTVNDLINGIVACATVILWTAYFALPEPRRRVIVLPTTSPFLRWNQISLALGDSPGHVAVGGVPPELFAPAELEVMRRASASNAVTPFPRSIGA